MLEIEIIQALPTTEIRDLYKQLFQSPPPAKSRKEFLLGNICWAIQVKDLGKQFKKLQEQLANQAQNKAISSKTQYMPGTRIIREWKGETHEVIVEESGYRWRNRQFKSLSHIAREITGTRWSGPRFFGLTNRVTS